MKHAQEKCEIHTKFWSENLKGRDHSLGRPRSRWEDKIRMYLRATRWESEDQMHVTQVREQWRASVNTVMNLWLP
jgi:hypothetical protein